MKPNISSLIQNHILPPQNEIVPPSSSLFFILPPQDAATDLVLELKIKVTTIVLDTPLIKSIFSSTTILKHFHTVKSGICCHSLIHIDIPSAV